MKQTTVLALLLALAVVSRAQLSFNLASAAYQINNGYYSLSVPVNGGVSPFSYSYQAFPTTWLQVGNNINIPLI